MVRRDRSGGSRNAALSDRPDASGVHACRVSTPLLSAKLSLPPLGRSIVPRPRLTARLDQGLTRPLTLISAPAGFGKTTLLSEWRASRAGRGFPLAWLSLDNDDNDPTRFLSYLVGALAALRGGVGETTIASLAYPLPPQLQPILINLLSDLGQSDRPFAVILDDYHVITAPQIHEALTFLLEHLPPQMHLVLLTRADPPLPLARLGARGQLVEIRAADLRFNSNEVAAFLNERMGLRLRAEDLAALEARTEGWITGLQLAALSMQGRDDVRRFVAAFTGSHRYIVDFLVEEVLNRQTDAVQSFLLQTCVLDRMNGSLCDALTERTDGQDALETLEQANLFIVPLDETRQWYRYHRLFADVLRHRLQVERAEGVPSLHRRAREWFEAEGYLTDAIQHALAGSDWDQAARLIGQASEPLLKRGEIVTLIGWCSRLPEAVLRSLPLLSISYAWALILAAQIEPAETILEHVEREAQDEPLTLGEVAAAQAYLARARGDNLGLIRKSEQALSLLPETDLAGRGLVALNLGLTYWHAGRLDDAQRVLLEAEDRFQRSGNHYGLVSARVFLARTLATRGRLRQAASMVPSLIQAGSHAPILALAHYDLCTIYYEWNDLHKAIEHLVHGMEISVHSGNAEFQNAGCILQAFLSLAQGDSAGALEAVERSHALTRDFPPAVRARSAACHVRVALALGDREAAQRWGEQLAENAEAHPFYRFLGLSRPLLLIAQGRRDVAAEELEGSYAAASQAGWGYALIAVRVLQALAAGSHDRALEFLADALRLGEPEGYVRTFVDAGESLVPLLLEAARDGIHPEYAGRIVAAIKGEGKRSVSEALSLVEPLSERELEVLRLVVGGLSNREIAAELVISPGTAKTHIHNVCGKLGVRNRTEAAVRAKELGLA